MKFVGDIIGVAFSTVGLLVALVVGRAWGPVSRAQLSTFAVRQRLEITPGNGELVIRYLAHTRRWRVAGVVAGIAAMAALSQIDRWPFLLVFAGWFSGAIIAELRLAAGPTGTRRVASLEPRTFHRYVGRTAWFMLPVAMVLDAAVAIGGALERHPLRQGTLLIIAGGVTPVVMVARTRIVDRAQSFARVELIAADDAIRSRALHVLCGGGAALVFGCVAVQFSLYPFDHASALSLLFQVIGVVVGGMIGTERFRVRRSAPEMLEPRAGATAAC